MSLVPSNRFLRLILTAFVALALGVRVHAGKESAVIHRAMLAADQDKDGRLSLAEFLRLDVQAKHHGEQHFADGDANNDGFLDEAELAVALRKQTWFAILSEGAATCFTRLDANADGKLDAMEYRKIARMPAHADQHFKEADKNGDRFLDQAEFIAHAEQFLKTLETSPATSRTKKN